MNDLLKTTKAVLLTTMMRWLSLTENMPEDLLIRTPLPNEWAAHDLMHTVQAERALLQPLIGGSGPWRLYFKDHDVSN